MRIGRSASRRSYSREPKLEGVDDYPRQSLLHRENIVDRAVVVVGPQVSVCACVDELSADSQPAARPPHAALEDVADTQFAGDGLHVLAGLLEHHRRRSGDDAEGAHLRKIGNDFVGETLGEVIVLLIGAEAPERQHCDRLRPFDERTSCAVPSDVVGPR